VQVLGNGQLFLISAVVAGGSFGELIAAFLARDFSGKGFLFKLFAILAGASTFLLVVANTAGYKTHADPSMVRDASQWLFLATLVPCAATIGMVATP
jgi:hypothetical protein